MDAADQADQDEESLRRAMQRSTINPMHRDTPEAIAIGECLWCGEPLNVGMRWCGAECRDDWEKEVSR
jgi:hypothetical protein